MATADSVKAKIQGLIDKINAKTGLSDNNLTSAVDAITTDTYTDTSSGDATKDDILYGKKAWVDGAEVTGRIVTYDGSEDNQAYIYNSDANCAYVESQLPGPAYVEDGLVYSALGLADLGDATAANVLSGKTFTSTAGVKVTGTMATATQATPTISVSTAGKITASATQTAGYVSAGTKSATRQLTVQAAKTVTPTTSNQTAVASGRYTTGAITVKGDANLVAGNIKSGVSIFGVAGTYTGSSGSSGGSVTTCTVVFATRNHQNRIRIGYTSYSDGSMQALHYTQNSGTSDVTLSNVPCGSAICIWTDPMNAVSGGATSVYTDSNFRVIQAPSASGTYTYSIEDDS